MPITFNCSCGKRLQVKDEFAGRRVKCPACTGVATAPAAEAEPQFEVVEDEEPAPAPARVRAKKAAAGGFDVADDEDDKPRKRARSQRDEDDDEDERPRSKRRRPRDDDDDEEPPRRKKPKRRAAADNNMGKRIGYMIGGVVLVLIGAGLALLGWNGEGRGATKMLIFGICLVVGGIGTGFKGLIGNVDDDE